MPLDDDKPKLHIISGICGRKRPKIWASYHDLPWMQSKEVLRTSQVREGQNCYLASQTRSTRPAENTRSLIKAIWLVPELLFRRESTNHLFTPEGMCQCFRHRFYCEHLEEKLHSHEVDKSPRTGLESTLTTLAGGGRRLFLHLMTRRLH